MQETPATVGGQAALIISSDSDSDSDSLFVPTGKLHFPARPKQEKQTVIRYSYNYISMYKITTAKVQDKKQFTQ